MKKKILKDKHHIYPKSRFPELRYDKDNQVIIDYDLHRHYHAIFSNKTPEEIGEVLGKYFWNGNQNAIKDGIQGLKNVLK